jgi:hypothetical protein
VPVPNGQTEITIHLLPSVARSLLWVQREHSGRTDCPENRRPPRCLEYSPMLEAPHVDWLHRYLLLSWPSSCTYPSPVPQRHHETGRAPRPPALPFLLETPQPTRQFTMREMSLAVLLCMLTLLLSGRHLSPGSGAHLQSHGRDEPGSGKVDRGTDGHSTPRLRCRPSRGRPPRAPQRRSPPACGGTCPAPAPGALHRTKRRGGTETVRDERHGSDRCDRRERMI